MAKETIIRKEPTISVIPLDRYITADGSKKEKILVKAKFQNTFMVARYSSPKSAINNFIKGVERKNSIFDDFI
ncbi:hypothetical protein NAF17_00010 [Mucilaginibacter sp. RB4R14]|uniref:hypothetical protein n=1 Tax=Mucilaginibacter aurantiaciroseus TaxID=2949308 RepID=UPI0020919B7D|nr:hypothetical protein [Mucilaginibacter aurantiaciroseus]MCO5933906.1 hypothetical protein [Mucilaginibacter aurantiaciroseus]